MSPPGLGLFLSGEYQNIVRFSTRFRNRRPLEATTGTTESRGWTKKRSPSVESDDDTEMVDGARILDVTSTGAAGPKWRSDWSWAREVSVFAGPAGKFFSDSRHLYSAGKDVLSKWDPKAGVRTGHIENFFPTRHHVGAGELVQLSDRALLRWSTSFPSGRPHSKGARSATLN